MITKQRTRRGKRNSEKYRNKNSSSIKSDGNWQILQSNIRGFNSKKISLNHIIREVDPNVKNEVAFKGNKKCSIQGYNTFTRNRQNHNMGGIATSIRRDEMIFCLKVVERR